ncbi:ribonuclease Y [Hydrogenobacter sp. T-2]|uniref:ribonuclease Y n=1 Tax=Pampinifervens diazotrophicum TaxID=1632018 RepID=UPI002B263BF5|nr:ribonuclease Y [Hydrogenobacter sp. T-2]WPM31756.1 ribonuclease Y [Hydrogenobacter sp. T-2]
MSVEVLVITVFLALAVGGALGFILSRKGSSKPPVFETAVDIEEKKKEAELIVSKAKEEAQEIIRKAQEEAREVRLNSEREAEKIVRLAQEEADRLRLTLKEETEKIRQDLDKKSKEMEEYLAERKQEIQKLEQALQHREANLERRVQALERREEELYRREKEVREMEKQVDQAQRDLQLKIREIDERKKEIEALRHREILELQRIASMSLEEARAELLRRVEEEAKIEAIRVAKRIEEEARERAEFEAKKIITTAVQRLSSEIAINYTTTTVELPSNEFKGRIIGREGRNIRTFELLTGVDLIIDDTPDIVTISSFDPMRRELAKDALERLIEDGRIHPARIEEVVAEVKKEMDEKIRKMGEETCMELGLYDINPGLYYYIGKLYYRTSYSQNVLLHSKEVAYLAGMMAEELGLDAKMARRAGLLHDIGKAISHELGGSHTDIGIELCKRYGEPDPVLNAIKAHHNEEPVRYPEVALVCAADALSAARPGARRESLEAYLKRLEKLEEIVKSFKGVQNAYAVQAGREVRVIVSPEEISDEEAYMLSKNIARKIEEEMQFPGQIKVVVIRETRHVEYAK